MTFRSKRFLIYMVFFIPIITSIIILMRYHHVVLMDGFYTGPPSEPVAVTSGATTSRRMVLPLVVREQMTMGISNVYDLASFARDPSWNASIVLPVLRNTSSRMVGIPTNNTYPLN